MSQDNREESGGLLHRLFGRGGHEPPGNGTTLDLGDIQGFILRGCRMPMVRHFLLSVGVPAKARKVLGRLVSGDESDAPQITTLYLLTWEGGVCGFQAMRTGLVPKMA